LASCRLLRRFGEYHILSPWIFAKNRAGAVGRMPGQQNARFYIKKRAFLISYDTGLRR